MYRPAQGHLTGNTLHLTIRWRRSGRARGYFPGRLKRGTPAVDQLQLPQPTFCGSSVSWDFEWSLRNTKSLALLVSALWLRSPQWGSWLHAGEVGFTNTDVHVHIVSVDCVAINEHFFMNTLAVERNNSILRIHIEYMHILYTHIDTCVCILCVHTECLCTHIAGIQYEDHRFFCWQEKGSS